MVLDATTQEGFAGTPLVELNGGGAILHGLTLSGVNSSGSTIRGLVIDQFTGIGIRAFSSNNVIAGNFLGTDPTVLTTAGRGNQVGVYVQTGGSNTIGGTAIADRNVISGNTVDGISSSTHRRHNRVEGNYIGTDVTGTIELGNTNQGILIRNGVQASNTIGGTTALARNVIGGNTDYGVWLTGAAATANNLVQGNYVGLARRRYDPAGPARRACGSSRGAHDNTIGGPTAGARNVIAASDVVRFCSARARPATSSRATTSAPTPPARPRWRTPPAASRSSVFVQRSNVIGGAAVGAGNVISGNAGTASSLAPGDGNTRPGQLHRHQTAAGTAAVRNVIDGIFVELASVGSPAPADSTVVSNVISGNHRGVIIADAGVTGNVSEGNFIGTDPTGAVATRQRDRRRPHPERRQRQHHRRHDGRCATSSAATSVMA